MMWVRIYGARAKFTERRDVYREWKLERFGR